MNQWCILNMGGLVTLDAIDSMLLLWKEIKVSRGCVHNIHQSIHTYHSFHSSRQIIPPPFPYKLNHDIAPISSHKSPGLYGACSHVEDESHLSS